MEQHEHITERDFLAGVVNLHTVQGKPPRCISIVHVLQSVADMSDQQIDVTLKRMNDPNRRKVMKRCTQIHVRLWKEYQDAL